MKSAYSYEYNPKSSKVVAIILIIVLMAFHSFFVYLYIFASYVLRMLIVMRSTSYTEETFDEVYDSISHKLLYETDFNLRANVKATVIIMIVSFILYYCCFIYKEKKAKVYRPISRKFDEWEYIVLILCMAVAVYCFVHFIGNFAVYLFPKENVEVVKVFEQARTSNPTLNVMYAMLIAPVFEELYFRGLILKICKRSFGMIWCLLFNGISFAVFHGNIIQASYAFFAGVYLAYLAFEFDTIIPSIFAHSLQNSFATLLPTFGGLFGIILYFTLLIGFGVLSYFLCRRAFPIYRPYKPEKFKVARRTRRTYG